MTSMKTNKGADGKFRCFWVTKDEIYIRYHDEEWGREMVSVDQYDDRFLFEMLTLESMQAGLSWLMVLKRRDNFRVAFDNFDPPRVANYDLVKQAALQNDPGIIRNRVKISAAINNASRLLQIQSEFGSFGKYLLKFQPAVKDRAAAGLPSCADHCAEAQTLAEDMRMRGFKFCGPTILYSFMQAIGMVNDHSLGCFKRGGNGSGGDAGGAGGENGGEANGGGGGGKGKKGESAAAKKRRAKKETNESDAAAAAAADGSGGGVNGGGAGGAGGGSDNNDDDGDDEKAGFATAARPAKTPRAPGKRGGPPLPKKEEEQDTEDVATTTTTTTTAKSKKAAAAAAATEAKKEPEVVEKAPRIRKKKPLAKAAPLVPLPQAGVRKRRDVDDDDDDEDGGAARPKKRATTKGKKK